MKKLLALIISLICVFSILTFTGCATVAGHTYAKSWTTDETHHWHICTEANCTEIIDKGEHTWDNGKITTYATPTQNGIKTYTCTICQKTKTDTILFTGISVSDEASLISALENGGYIYLENDIEINSTLLITCDTTIIGTNNTLTYTGSNRAIDVKNETNGANLTLANLTINSTASWCERGVNYNTNGTLLLDNVAINAKNQNYAINLPGKSDNAKVIINNSKITSFIALNVWGEKTNIVINNSELYSVGNDKELGGAISINVDAGNRADYSSISINGGKIVSLFVDNTTPALAIRNYTNGTIISISNETVVKGEILNSACVATASYPPSNYFYAYTTLQDAVDKVAQDVANGSSNAIVILTGNINVDTLDVPSNVTIDLNGYSLTVTTITGDDTALTIIGTGTYNGLPQ